MWRPLRKTFKKGLIAHDWGSAIAYLLDLNNPGYFSSFISLDIGGRAPEGLQYTLFNICYQHFLSTAFLIGGKFGEGMNWIIMNLLFTVKMNTPEVQARVSPTWNYF
jgi:hypothetical protein